jgi:hypothetical protein
VAEIDSFDLDESTAQAWTQFAERLSEVISVIDESGDLTIGTESAAAGMAPYVAFHCPRRDLLVAEAAGNATLGADYQLSATQLAQMEALGWQPPSPPPPAPASPHSSRADARHPDNFWLEAAQEDSERVGNLAVSTLRDVYGVPHPVFLAPSQLAEVLQPAPQPIPEPSTPRPARPSAVLVVQPGSHEQLDDLIDDELTNLFGHRPIRDSEGDVAIRVGSTMIFLRTALDGQEIVIFAAVVHDIVGRSRAAEVLNDLNVEARWVKFQLVRDRVFVTFSILARPFVPAHLRQALRVVSEVADGIDEELAVKLSGRTTFGDRDDLG